jgi:hypothetical protein
MVSVKIHLKVFIWAKPKFLTNCLKIRVNYQKHRTVIIISPIFVLAGGPGATIGFADRRCREKERMNSELFLLAKCHT